MVTKRRAEEILRKAIRERDSRSSNPKYIPRAFGVLAFVLFLSVLFPPWIYTTSAPNAPSSSDPAGYSFLALPPLHEESPRNQKHQHFHGVEIDYRGLMLSWLGLLALSAAAYVSLRSLETLVAKSREK